MAEYPKGLLLIKFLCSRFTPDWEISNGCVSAQSAVFGNEPNFVTADGRATTTILCQKYP